MIKLLCALGLFLLGNLLALGQSTNVLLTLRIDCNESNLVTFLPMAVGFTNHCLFFDSVVGETVMPEFIELKAVTYCGNSVLAITNPIATNLFYTDLALTNAAFVPSQHIEYYGETPSPGCSSLIIDIIPSGNPLIPSAIILICLDGVPCLDFGSG